MNPHYALISVEDLATTRSELEYFKIYELRKKSKNAEGWTVQQSTYTVRSERFRTDFFLLKIEDTYLFF